MIRAMSSRIPREQLEPLVLQGLTIAMIAQSLGTSPQSVQRAIDRLGLPKPIEVRRRLITDALRKGRRSLVRECRRHGITEFAIVGSESRLHCKRCRAEAVARRRRRIKEQLVAEAGGACIICGYDRCINALEHHHRDPKTKLFGLAQQGVTRSIEEVRREAAKCALLCANCHAEVEAGVTKLPEVEDPGG
jgi:hypothetical protein